MKLSDRDRRQSERGALAAASARQEAAARPAARSASKPAEKLTKKISSQPVTNIASEPEVDNASLSVANTAAEPIHEQAVKHVESAAERCSEKQTKLVLNHSAMHGHRSDAAGKNTRPARKRACSIGEPISRSARIKFAEEARVYNANKKARKPSGTAPESGVSGQRRIKIVHPKSEYTCLTGDEYSSETESDSAFEDLEPDHSLGLVKDYNGNPRLRYAAAGLDMLSAAARLVSPECAQYYRSGNGGLPPGFQLAGLGMPNAATQNWESLNNTGTASQAIEAENDSEDEDCQCEKEQSKQNTSNDKIADQGEDADNKQECQSCVFSTRCRPMIIEAAKDGKIQWRKREDNTPFVKPSNSSWPSIQCDRSSVSVARLNMFALRRQGHITAQECSRIIDCIDVAEKYSCLRKTAKQEAKDAYWERQELLEGAQVLGMLRMDNRGSQQTPRPQLPPAGRARRIIKLRVRPSSD